MIEDVLVRYLQFWAQGAGRAVHGGTYLHLADKPTSETKTAIMDVLGAGVSVVFVGEGTQHLQGDGVYATNGPANVVLKALQATTGPVFVFADGKSPEGITGKPVDTLIVDAEPNEASELEYRATTVHGQQTRTVWFGTRSAKSLEAFKDALWELDPHEPEALESAIVEAVSDRTMTVTEIKHFVLTDTPYRSSDAERVIRKLLEDGKATRRPEEGRLGGDVRIAIA